MIGYGVFVSLCATLCHCTFVVYVFVNVVRNHVLYSHTAICIDSTLLDTSFSLFFVLCFFVYFICLLCRHEGEIIKLCDELHNLQIRVAKISRFSLVLCVYCTCMVSVLCVSETMCHKILDVVFRLAVWKQTKVFSRVHIVYAFQFIAQISLCCKMPTQNDKRNEEKLAKKSFEERFVVLSSALSGEWGWVASCKIMCNSHCAYGGTVIIWSMFNECQNSVDAIRPGELTLNVREIRFSKLQGRSISRVHNSMIRVLEALGAHTRSFATDVDFERIVRYALAGSKIDKTK